MLNLVSMIAKKPSPRPILFSHIPAISLVIFPIGCESTLDAVIESVSPPPGLLSVSISPSIVNTDTVNVGSDFVSLQIRLSATTGTPGIGEKNDIVFSLSKDIGTQIAVGKLVDSGVFPDSVASDGTFTGLAQFSIKRVEVAPISVEIWPESHQGLRGTSHIRLLTIVRANQAPVISNLVVQQSTETILLELSVTDPDGQEDIARVIFHSFRPDGSLTTGSPFSMFDDGNVNNSGDRIANDGIFSRRALLPAGTAPASYRFEFQAFDRLNADSNIITRFLP